MSHTCNIFMSLLILLLGDIQSNPGPVSRVSSLNICNLNIRSFTNALHYTAIADLADTHNIDVFALSETWISPNTTFAQLFDAIPPGFTFINRPILLVLFLIHPLLQSLVAAQHFFSVNLANFSPHLLLLLNLMYAFIKTKTILRRGQSGADFDVLYDSQLLAPAQ